EARSRGASSSLMASASCHDTRATLGAAGWAARVDRAPYGLMVASIAVLEPGEASEPRAAVAGLCRRAAPASARPVRRKNVSQIRTYVVLWSDLERLLWQLLWLRGQDSNLRPAG